MTIGESVEKFCLASGRTKEQVLKDFEIRKEWVRWHKRTFGVGGPITPPEVKPDVVTGEGK